MKDSSVNIEPVNKNRRDTASLRRSEVDIEVAVSSTEGISNSENGYYF